MALVALLGAPSAAARRHAAEALRGRVDARADLGAGGGRPATRIATCASSPSASWGGSAPGRRRRARARARLVGDEATAAAAARALGQIYGGRADRRAVDVARRGARAQRAARAARGGRRPRPRRRRRRHAAAVARGAHGGARSARDGDRGARRRRAPPPRRHRARAALRLRRGQRRRRGAGRARRARRHGRQGPPCARLQHLVESRFDDDVRGRARGRARRHRRRRGRAHARDHARRRLRRSAHPRRGGVGARQAHARRRRRRRRRWRQALHASAPAVRANAAAALFRLGRAPDDLLRLVDDRDPAVRGNAALALGQHAPRRARRSQRLAERDDDRSRPRRRQARARRRRRPPPPPTGSRSTSSTSTARRSATLVTGWSSPTACSARASPTSAASSAKNRCRPAPARCSSTKPRRHVRLPGMGLAALIIPMIPGVIWLWIIYRTDLYEPEPKRLVLATFALGVLAIVPAFGGERLAGMVYPFLALHRGGRGHRRDGAGADGHRLLPRHRAVRGDRQVPRRAPLRLSPQGVQRAARRHHLRGGGGARLRQPRERALRDRLAHGPASSWGALGVRSLLALPGHVIFATTWGYALGRQKFDPVVSRLADGGAGGAAARALRLPAHVSRRRSRSSCSTCR